MADYPISNVARRIVYTGSAGVGPYAFPFEVLTNTDINVYKNDTLLTLTTNYSVTISPTLGTGSVTLVSAANSSDRITIIGARAVERTTDFTTGGDFFANTLNDEMDSQTILVQQVAETAERSIKAPVTDPTSIDMTLPNNTDRAGKYLSFNATTGDPEVVNTVTDVTTVAGISSAVTTVAGISTNVTTVAGNTTNINTVATNISNVNATGSNISNVNAVAGNATNINAVNSNSTNINTVAGNNTNVSTVATNISSVNTNASNITAIQNASSNASAAASSASAASTSASNAASSASSASTSATNAASAQTAAESARDATLAAYDSFDDRYLGAKSTAPTVDNDGNALVAGALYFDTVAQSMQLYTGTIWTAAYISGSGYLASANNLSELSNFVTARANLGLTIGANVQAYDADLATIAALSPTADNFIVGNGTAWILETPAQARTSLGLGTIATLTAPAGTVVGTSDSQTLTNKTINGSNNTLTNVSLITAVTGTLPVANGGTNNNALGVVAGGVYYGDGTKVVETAAGTSGQLLQSNGASAPTWVPAPASIPGIGGQVFTANGTFTIPSGVTLLKVTVVGGGGGGRGSTGSGKTNVTAFSGGGGGAAVTYLTGLTPGGTLSVTIGGAGSGGNVGNGSAGGTTSVSSGTQAITTISATGGGAGVSNGQGAGGTGSGGSVNYTGQTGGGASPAASSQSPAFAVGGGSIFNGGGLCNANSPNGTNASTYGGGGSGSLNANGPAGNGFAGVVIFEW